MEILDSESQTQDHNSGRTIWTAVSARCDRLPVLQLQLQQRRQEVEGTHLQHGTRHEDE